jgi:uncharacterized protein (TIGR03545 family)
LGILVLIGFGISMLSMDRWIERGLEKAGETLVGARVEIDNLDIRPLSLSVEWDRLQVTDPNHTMSNAIESGRAAFRLNPAALLRKKVIIQEMALEDLQWGTPRETDGALPKKKSASLDGEPDLIQKVQDRLDREIKDLPVIGWEPGAWKGKIRVDSLLAAAELRTPVRLDSVQEAARDLAGRWAGFYRNFKPDRELTAITDEVKAVNLSELNNLTSLLETYEKLNSVKQRFNALSDTVSVRIGLARADVNNFESYREQIPLWIEEDYQRVLQKARLPRFSRERVAMALFGPMVVRRVQQSLDVLRIGRKVLGRAAPPKPRRPRLKGRTVHYPDRNRWPSFLIENLHVSTISRGGTGVRGEVQGVTTQPGVYGKPMTASLSGTREDGRGLTLEALLDHTTPVSRDSFRVALTRVPLRQVTMSPGSGYTFLLRECLAGFQGTGRITENAFRFQANIRLDALTWDFDAMESDDVLARTLRQVLESARSLRVETGIHTAGEKTLFSLESNVDEEITRTLTRMAGETLAETRQAVRRGIVSGISGKQQTLDALWLEKKEEIMGPLTSVSGRMGSVQQELESKLQEVTTELVRKQGEGDLQDKAKDLLDRILKPKK